MPADSDAQPPPPELPEGHGFTFAPVDTADGEGRVMFGGDLGPATLVAAYRAGIFPMRQGDGRLAWWSPDPRAVIAPDRFHVTRSLRQSSRRFRTTVDAAFEAVVEGCADRPEGAYHWITPEIRHAYLNLHRLGWAHSVETWTVATVDEPSELAGGLYGVAIGGLFCGESMFHRRADASKVALVRLIEVLGGDGLIDVQWMTPHMASLGAVEVPREEYLAMARQAMALPVPADFTGSTRRGG
jgi:leucyl/phenylalanyl-tRNA--protein transferase